MRNLVMFSLLFNFFVFNATAASLFTSGSCEGTWGSNIIYYEMDRDFERHYGKSMNAVIYQFHQMTPMRFRKGKAPRGHKQLTMTNDRKKYNGGLAKCRSRRAEANLWGLSDRSIDVKMAFITHEILHTLGFAHEQSRHDRDRYVHVRTGDNKKQASSVCESGSGFDFASQVYNLRNSFPAKQTVTNDFKVGSRLLLGKILSYQDAISLYRVYGSAAQKKAKCKIPAKPVFSSKPSVSGNNLRINVKAPDAARYLYIKVDSKRHGICSTDASKGWRRVRVNRNQNHTITLRKSDYSKHLFVHACPASIEVPQLVPASSNNYTKAYYHIPNL